MRRPAPVYRWLCPAALVIFALVLGIAASSSLASSTATRPIKVAFITDLTGVYSSPAINEAKGFNLGLHDFGSHVAGHPIELKYFDTNSDPVTALSQARAAINQWHADMIEGPIFSSEIGAVASYVGPLGVPIDDLALCSAPQISEYQKYGTGYASDWGCDQPSLIGAEWAYKDKKWRHVVTIASDYAFGWVSVGGFENVFKKLGGTVDKSIWVPITTGDYAPYIAQIPQNTQFIWAEFAGATAVRFLQAFKQFGLAGKIPVLGTTTVTDYSALPAEGGAALGVYSDANYCDGINTPANNAFVKEYYGKYGTYPGYYSEAGYTKARILINTLKRLHGDVTNKKKFVAALRSFDIVAPRGPVKLDRKYWAPIENVYICQVKRVNGDLRNVVLKTYPNVPLWGPLTESEWLQHFLHDSTARPG